MKKYLSLVLALVLALIIGVRYTNAALAIPGKLATNSDGSFDCKTLEEKNADGAKVTVCNFKFQAGESTTIGEGITQTFNVTYDQPNSMSGFKVTQDGELGITSDVKSTTENGSFAYTYTSGKTIEKGKTYTLFTIEFYSDPSIDKCGGKITGGPVDGGSNTGDDNKTSSDEVPDLGFSIPVAIIGIGAVTGLAVYSVSSRKTKLHRI